MNLFYIGLIGSSGYAIGTRYFIFNYLMDGCKVTYQPITADNSAPHDSDIITTTVSDCIYNQYSNYDYLVCNFVPDYFKDKDYSHIGDRNYKKVLQTVWETTRISEDWVEYINNSDFNELWLPSNFNKKAFEDSGVTIPIKIKKYISYNFINKKSKDEVDLLPTLKFGDSDITQTYNFYNISTWNTRKNNLNTIKTFCDTFTNNDNVSLLIKTNDFSYYPEFITLLKAQIEELLKKYSNPPTLVFYCENYTTSQINDIHNLGDCYYLLHRGEGLGFSSYDAYLNHKPVITTGFGGHKEYFSDNYPYFVDYKLTNVFGMDNIVWYKHEHEWAEPNYEHARYLLKHIYDTHKWF